MWPRIHSLQYLWAARTGSQGSGCSAIGAFPLHLTTALHPGSEAAGRPQRHPEDRRWAGSCYFSARAGSWSPVLAVGGTSTVPTSAARGGKFDDPWEGPGKLSWELRQMQRPRLCP